MSEDLKRVDSLIARCERSMRNAYYANTRNEFQDTLYEARILRAKMMGDLDGAAALLREHIGIMSAR